MREVPYPRNAAVDGRFKPGAVGIREFVEAGNEMKLRPTPNDQSASVTVVWRRPNILDVLIANS